MREVEREIGDLKHEVPEHTAEKLSRLGEQIRGLVNEALDQRRSRSRADAERIRQRIREEALRMREAVREARRARAASAPDEPQEHQTMRASGLARRRPNSRRMHDPCADGRACRQSRRDPAAGARSGNPENPRLGQSWARSIPRRPTTSSALCWRSKAPSAAPNRLPEEHGKYPIGVFPTSRTGGGQVKQPDERNWTERGLFWPEGAAKGWASPRRHSSSANATLLEVIVGRLENAFKEVIVVAPPAALADAAFAAPAGARVVHDSTPFEGPLAGLARGIEAAIGDPIFACSCDLPLLSVNVASELCALIGYYDAAIPEVGGILQPLHAAYRKRCAGAIAGLIESGERRAIALANAIKVRKIGEHHLRLLDPGLRSFFNINTPTNIWPRSRSAGLRTTAQRFLSSIELKGHMRNIDGIRGLKGSSS